MAKKERPQLDLFREPADKRIQKRFENLRALADRGATEGERKAARKGMERLIAKYDLTDEHIHDTLKVQYFFKYASDLDWKLFCRLYSYFLETNEKIYVRYEKWDGHRYVDCREIVVNLSRMDYITMDCAFGYFRPHMNKQWREIALPEINRHRKPKTKNQKRKLLQDKFFVRYCIASGLYREEELQNKEISNRAELEAILMFRNVEGGEFNQQVGTGLYLEN